MSRQPVVRDVSYKYRDWPLFENYQQNFQVETHQNVTN